MAIAVRDLSMRFPTGHGELTVLDHVSLEISAGEFVAVTGPSGSGKSTLLGLIAGLDHPSEGSVVVMGHDVTRLEEARLARFRLATIGYVFQSFHLLPTLTAQENVAVPLELAGIRDAVARAQGLLARVGLGGRSDHYPAQLSGGEQQRVAIARAMALSPPVMLADEPTGNLDSATAAEVIDLLLALRRERAATLVMVTHDPALARHANREVRLLDGRVVGAARAAGAPPA